MILEIFIIMAIFLGGSALIRITGIRGWALPALGFVAGICLHVVIGSLLAITGLPTNPIITLILIIVFPFAWWFICLMRNYDVAVKWQNVLLSCIIVIILVMIFREANLVNWHNDTFRYLMTGKLLADNNYYAVTHNILTKRLLALPLIHAPANLLGEYYLRSLSPLLAISTIIIFCWFFNLGLKNKISNKYYIFYSVSGLLLLLTNNRFIFNAFYVNAHLLFATLLLIIVGCNWLLVRRADVPEKALLTIQILAIPTLIVTRPEAFIVAGLALIPFLICDQVPWRHRKLILAIYGLSVAVWYSYILIIFFQRGYDVMYYSMPLSVYLPPAVGIFCILVIPLISLQFFKEYLRLLPAIFEIVLWLALFVLTVLRHDILFRSIHATIENVLFDAGSWGFSLAVIAFLICGVIVFTNAPNRLLLRFPVTTFVPVSFLLAYLRGSAYRVGDGDSLNRALIHIVPLAILFIISSVESERWGLPVWIKKKYLRLKKTLKKFIMNKSACST